MKIEIKLSDDDIKTLDFLEDHLASTWLDAYAHYDPYIKEYDKCYKLIERIVENIEKATNK